METVGLELSLLDSSCCSLQWRSVWDTSIIKGMSTEIQRGFPIYNNFDFPRLVNNSSVKLLTCRVPFLTLEMDPHLIPAIYDSCWQYLFLTIFTAMFSFFRINFTTTLFQLNDSPFIVSKWLGTSKNNSSCDQIFNNRCRFMVYKMIIKIIKGKTYCQCIYL